MFRRPAYVGNLFVSPQPMERKGDEIGGHTHYFDHVSFLVRGSVEVFVEGHDPKVLVAPTFVIIRKHTRHRIVALEDNTEWFCIFAIRDLDGNTQDVVSEEVDPWFVYTAGNFWETHELDYQPTKADTVPFQFGE
jgi:hypothetical protein